VHVRLPAIDDPLAWVREHLADLTLDGTVEPSGAFRGGQTAADTALALWSPRGYANARNKVWPPEARGASRLSPWIRHGLIGLRRLWDHVEPAPKKDKEKLRDELLWQEYARHLNARLGRRLGEALRFEQALAEEPPWDEPWPREMRCMELVAGELEADGWVVNQARMWLASQWGVRAQHDWRAGERLMHAHLLDGSRAANRLGWQWTVGTAIGRPYGFARWQVEKRAPGVCGECVLRDRCPIQEFPQTSVQRRVEPPPLLRADPDPGATGGPEAPEVRGEPESVWLTAESLGDADPALAAWPDRPAVFVFDEPYLRSTPVSGKRLVFLAECLADLATRRPVELLRGDPREVLAGRRLAATWTPVRGWRKRSAALDLVAVHPWPWLVRPHAGPAQSMTAWRRAIPKAARP
jgi:deoxyribodipyrimidine photo-lyase